VVLSTSQTAVALDINGFDIAFPFSMCPQADGPFGICPHKAGPLQIFPEPGKRLRPRPRLPRFQGIQRRYSADFGKGKAEMRFGAVVIAAICLATPLWAEAGRPGAFDYYVLSLGWSPNWCALEGDARHDPQCAAGRNLGWTLHGLWPQNESGYPSYCRTVEGDPTRGDTAQMADIMGGSGLAFYEWKKHGRCAGLSAKAYYGLMREAYTAVTLPPVFAQISEDLNLPASVIEDAFVESNPQLSRNGLTVTCKSGRIQEVRICLTKDLQPRPCGADVVKDCTLVDAELDAVR
jgi:ribonuclease T2